MALLWGEARRVVRKSSRQCEQSASREPGSQRSDGERRSFPISLSLLPSPVSGELTYHLPHLPHPVIARIKCKICVCITGRRAGWRGLPVPICASPSFTDSSGHGVPSFPPTQEETCRCAVVLCLSVSSDARQLICVRQFSSWQAFSHIARTEQGRFQAVP